MNKPRFHSLSDSEMLRNIDVQKQRLNALQRLLTTVCGEQITAHIRGYKKLVLMYNDDNLMANEILQRYFSDTVTEWRETYDEEMNVTRIYLTLKGV